MGVLYEVVFTNAYTMVAAPDIETKSKIDAYNKEAWIVRVGDSERAFELSKAAVALSKELGYQRGLADGLRTFGFTHIRLAQHETAKELLQQALDLYQEMEDVNGQSDIYEYFGIIERSLGNLEASLSHLYHSLELRQQTAYRDGESLNYYHLGVTYKYLGQYDKALEFLLQCLSIAREINYNVSESYSLNVIGQIYFETEQWEQALHYFEQSLQIRQAMGDKWGEAGCLDNIGYVYYKTGQLQKAIDYCKQSLAICQTTSDKKGQANALYHLSEINLILQQEAAALSASQQSLQIRQAINDKKGQAEVLLFQADLLLHQPGSEDDVMPRLQQALTLGNEVKALDLLAHIHHKFYEAYKLWGQPENALASLEQYYQLERALHIDTLAQKMVNLETAHRAEQAQIEAENYRLRNLELAALYDALKKQQEETEIQKQKAESSLLQLQQTQAQLIQREKMASLGELTAGIAHEIQNPLNFVNNFSDVNRELIEELEQANDRGDLDEVATIAATIKENEQKISYHGMRADAIVKSMLQHSRINTGTKQPLAIDAVCEEYLRLSYHGFRAKDQTFLVAMQITYDESIDKINMVPQDLGRILLNLFNNAFYAVNEKRATAGKEYKPKVTVQTKKVNDAVTIAVCDNGNGISPQLIDKIFQPFFTTKPTGKGTGLGLSITYDIIKAYGGELHVNTQEGEGSTFIVELPHINL